MYSKYSHVVQLDGSLWKGNGVRMVAPIKKFHHVRLDREFRLDCQVWYDFLSLPSRMVINRPMIDLTRQVTANQLNFFTDASASEILGFGCVYDKRWTWGFWPQGFIRQFHPSIEYLELFALCIGILTWELELSNMRIIVFCDNESVVSMVNDTASKCPNCMYLLRILVLNCLKFNRRVFCRHIMGKANKLADFLSRGKLAQFRKLAPDMNQFLDSLPESMWPISKLWNE